MNDDKLLSKNVKILIPFNKLISESVLDSLRVQNVDFELVECIFDEAIPKRKRIIMSKTRCKEIGLKCNCKYVVINDMDLEHIQADNIKVMTEFLDKNLNFGATALVRKDIFVKDIVYVPGRGPNEHICSGVIMFSQDALKKVDFARSDIRPTCFSIAESLYACGLKYGYVDKTIRIQTL